MDMIGHGLLYQNVHTSRGTTDKALWWRSWLKFFKVWHSSFFWWGSFKTEWANSMIQKSENVSSHSWVGPSKAVTFVTVAATSIWESTNSSWCPQAVFDVFTVNSQGVGPGLKPFGEWDCLSTPIDNYEGQLKIQIMLIGQRKMTVCRNQWQLPDIMVLN